GTLWGGYSRGTGGDKAFGYLGSSLCVAIFRGFDPVFHRIGSFSGMYSHACAPGTFFCVDVEHQVEQPIWCHGGRWHREGVVGGIPGVELASVRMETRWEHNKVKMAKDLHTHFY